MPSDRKNERVAYFNGEIVPESQALVPFRDRGFKYGDAVFDMTRTFGHRIFKLDEHLDRFYKSLSYVRIDPGIGKTEMKDATMQVVEENLKLLNDDDDYWVGQRVSRGVDLVGGDMWATDGGPDCHHRMHTVAVGTTRALIPRWNRCMGTLNTAHQPRISQPACQIPQLPEPHHGRP